MENDSHKLVEFHDVVEARVSRRKLLKVGGTAGAASFLAGTSTLTQAVTQATTLMNFPQIPVSTEDAVSLPAGYSHDILVKWGDPITKKAAKFSIDNTAAEQVGQFGDNTDGMSLFHLTDKNGNMDESRAVMAVNSEYINKKFMHTHKGDNMTADDVKKEIAAHGVNIFEVKRNKKNEWSVQKNSELNRRLHGDATEFEMTGPVAGHPLVQTELDKSGKTITGTLNNCGNGQTPWGTYLTCEENFNGYFGAPEGTELSKEQLAYGLSETGFDYNWWQTEKRFDLSKSPNEANRFGWVVEIDPYDPSSKAKKRSALGRFKHENAALTLSKDGHAVVYMGDDERGEFIYKFVSKNTYKEGNRAHNMTLLEEGTLYAAKFNDNGSGQWVELTFGKNGLTKFNGFESQEYVLVYARIAARFVGATTMDRPEWVACHPSSPMVFCTLTNNKYRGEKDSQPLNAANPRAQNPYGHIIRWVPENRDHMADRFGWDIFAMAGNPVVQTGAMAGSDNVNADNMFNSPDGLAFDADGRLWIQTDGNYKNEGIFEGQGNNQMLVADPTTGHIRRFMVGPRGCEITGITFSNDQRTVFVGIQHPNEAWPNAAEDGVPRSSVIAIRRDDGGIVGA
jgi:secreted PhoX family phosphatase